jgi:hypothetical protein
MPTGGIFTDAVPSPNVAIRYFSPKIALDFMALGVPADTAGPGHHNIGEGFSDIPLRLRILHQRVPVLSAPQNPGQKERLFITLKIYSTAHTDAIAQSPKVRVRGERDSSGLVGCAISASRAVTAHQEG